MKKIIYIISVLAVLLCPAKAQDTAQNYVKTVTMLNADGTDSLQAVQYYNGLGYPTFSAVTTGGNGETAYSLTTPHSVPVPLLLVRRQGYCHGTGICQATKCTCNPRR